MMRLISAIMCLITMSLGLYFCDVVIPKNNNGYLIGSSESVFYIKQVKTNR